MSSDVQIIKLVIMKVKISILSLDESPSRILGIPSHHNQLEIFRTMAR